jgi:hypothetical protein
MAGYDIGGGYGYLDPQLAAYNLALQAQNQNLSRYGAAGYTPIVLDPNVNYYNTANDAWNRYVAANPGTVATDATGRPNKTQWVAVQTAATGLPASVLSQQYDTVYNAGYPLSADEWNRSLTGIANTAMPTLDAQNMLFNQGLQAGQLTGTYNGQPTLSAQELASLDAYRNGMLGVAQGELGVKEGQLDVNRGQLDVNRGQLDVSRGDLTGYFNGNPTLAREDMYNKYGAQLLQLAANLRGPENYFQYANMLRGVQNSPQLAYAQALLNNGKLSAYGNWGPSTPASLQGLLGPTSTTNTGGNGGNGNTGGTGNNTGGTGTGGSGTGGSGSGGTGSGGLGNRGEAWQTWWSQRPDLSAQIRQWMGTRPSDPAAIRQWMTTRPDSRTAMRAWIDAMPSATTSAPVTTNTTTGTTTQSQTANTSGTGQTTTTAQDPGAIRTLGLGNLFGGSGGGFDWSNWASQLQNYQPTTTNTGTGTSTTNTSTNTGGTNSSGSTTNTSENQSLENWLGQTPTIPSPWQTNVRQIRNMNPTERSMWNSALSAQGYQPQDWWEYQARSAPRGTASATTSWRV